MQAFEHFGGTPREILYDRMKTAVLGEPEQDKAITYNAKLLARGAHYGFAPRACQPYRAKTKGKVERPFRYIRADFFMARSFQDLQDMNHQLRHWLYTVANVRVHASTQRVVLEHFQEERPSCRLCRPVVSMRCCARSDVSAVRAASVSAATTTACPTAPAGARWMWRPPPIRCASMKTGV